MRNVFFILMLCSVVVFSQQTTQFTQFTFNKYGYNPAAAGSNINAKLETICGVRRQWIGFHNGPFSNFFSSNYTFKPERSYKRWHNAGVYISNDNAGIFQNYGIYGSYTIHIPLNNKYTASFGVFAGIRRFGIVSKTMDPADPVVKSTADAVWGYPDFIPGLRLYNKRMFFDVSVQQIYKNEQAQGGKQIGGPSYLANQVYISYGRRFFLENNFVLVPAVNIHSSYTHLPSVEFNFMAYYNRRIGLGASVRGKNFVSGILQLRLIKNSTIGFAYDYSITPVNSAAPHTVEIMFGITPFMKLEGDRMKNSVARCPSFDY